MDKTGYRPDPRKIKIILEMKMPETLKSLRGLLGFVGFYRILIPKFSQLVKPLTYLTTKAAKIQGVHYLITLLKFLRNYKKFSLLDHF